MPRRRVCVHLHFEAPRPADPWTGLLPREEACLPHRDPGERLAERVAGPLALRPAAAGPGWTRLLERAAFDMPPSWLAWLERERPSLYRRVLEADRAPAADAGEGRALAQPYEALPLPGLPGRDARALVRWGLEDFRARFGRPARGLWLPELAADDATLELLAREGLRFTILDPESASHIRPAGGAWEPCAPDSLDPRTPLLWRSPRDPSLALALFFRHPRLSRAAAEGPALADGAAFARAVLSRLLPGAGAQLVHAALPAEALAAGAGAAMDALAAGLDLLAAEGVPWTAHDGFLGLFPPPREARLRPAAPPPAAGRPGWEAPLSRALDALTRRLDALYEDEAGRLFPDPWEARARAGRLWAARTGEEVSGALEELAGRPLGAPERGRALRLLLLQRERLGMLAAARAENAEEDLSSERTAAALARAARALELARGLGEDAEAAFVERLAECPSGRPGLKDGAAVWRRLVLPRATSLERAAAAAALQGHLELPAPRGGALRARSGPPVRARKSGAGGREPSFSIAEASAEREDSRESGRWWAAVHQADRLDLACWLIPRPAGELDAAALAGEFLSADGEELRRRLTERHGAPHGVDALAPEDRAGAAATLLRAGQGRERAAFLARWASAVAAARAGGREDDAVLELLLRAPELGFLPEALPWREDIEERLFLRLEEAAVRLDPASASRAARWLDALGEAPLARGRWRLLDACARAEEAASPAPAGEPFASLRVKLTLRPRAGSPAREVE